MNTIKMWTNIFHPKVCVIRFLFCLIYLILGNYSAFSQNLIKGRKVQGYLIVQFGIDSVEGKAVQLYTQEFVELGTLKKYVSIKRQNFNIVIDSNNVEFEYDYFLSTEFRTNYNGLVEHYYDSASGIEYLKSNCFFASSKPDIILLVFKISAKLYDIDNALLKSIFFKNEMGHEYRPPLDNPYVFIYDIKKTRPISIREAKLLKLNGPFSRRFRVGTIF